MKKMFSLLLIILLIFSLSVGCSPNNAPVQQPDPTDENPVDGPTFSDGVYFAIEDGFNDKTGWKNHVAITVKNGKIVDAVWNGTNRIPSLDKNTQSEDGSYGMVTYGGAQGEWHTQAKATIDYFLELQSTELPEGFYKDTSGHTDAIAGVSMRVTEFFDLAAKALDNDSVPSGNYTDGYPYILIGTDSHGWQYGGQLIIVNGTIVDANFNAVSISQLNENGKFADKKGLMDTYGMKNGGATYEWYEHANMVGEYVVATQGFNVNYIDEQGHTDSIAGVSIHVNEMETVFNILTSKSQYQDGIYYASEEDYNTNTGWKHHVVVRVQNGRIAEAKWDGTHRIPQQNKFTQSETGEYGMVQYGEAQTGWYNQAKATELYLLNAQTADIVSDFYTDESGHTDAIAGVSIHVKGYFDLVKKALSNNPIPTGIYRDGYPYSMLDPDNHGYKYASQLTIVNGTIVGANFNAVNVELDSEGKIVDKKGLKEDYGMKANGATYEWYEHANMVEDFVVATQGFDIEYIDENGHTDTIAGVSIHVNEMQDVFKKTISKAQTYADGMYFAEENEFSTNSGWKNHIILTVKGGKIVDAVWSGTNRVPKGDKYSVSLAGQYGMVEIGGAQSEWHEQADATINYLLSLQTPYHNNSFYTDEAGHTDAIAGVSIHVKEFFELATKALSSGPVQAGDYTDGYYSAALDPDSNGYLYTGEFIIINGTIVSANFNASSTDNEGNIIDKKGLKEDYGMKNSGAAMEWYQHANLVEDYVLTNQSFNVNYTDEEGHTDSIAGVSIHVNEMNEVFNKALGIE